MKKTLAGISTAILLGGLSISASAGVITWQTLGTPEGETSGTVDGFATVSVSNSVLASKSRTDQSGTFIEGFGTLTNPKGEISAGQSILIDFTNPVVINRFSLAFLFPANAAADTINEMAMVAFGDGDGQFGTLQATSTLEALWTFGGESFNATNLSPADSSKNSAAWEVLNPFGGTEVNFLRFTAQFLDGGGQSDSDFAIVEVAVPEPGMLALLALGLFGLGFSGRRAARRK